MATLNNREDFATAYSDLLSRHDYRGLVGLLSSTNFSNDEANKTAKNLIAQFTEQADIEDKLLEGADPRTRSAYNFITSGPSSTELDDDTSFSSRFMQNWNDLSNEEGTISLGFPSELQFNKFMSSLGINQTNASSKGITLGSNYRVSFQRDVQNKVDIYNALRESGMIDYAVNRMKLINDVSNGEAYYSPANDPNKDSVYSTLAKMSSIADEANDVYSKLLENTKPYISEMVVSGYMGEDDKQLQQSFSAGLLDLQTFKEMRSILEEKYDRILQTKSLSQFDVWSMNEDNEGSQLLQKLDDNILKSQLDEEINQAIADKRLHFSHASNGIDIGTMIIIDPRVDKDGKPIKSDNNKPRRLFVKDLFRSQAENALRNDTQTHAQMEYAKHQTYKHSYRGADGSTITDWNQASDNAVYTDKNGVSQVLGKAQLLDIIDDDIIVKRMIDYYDIANQQDKNGNGYTSEYYKVYGGNGFNSADLYNNIAAKCTAAVANKYKGQSPDFIKYRAQELVANVLRGLGIDFEDELLRTNPENVVETLLRNKGVNLK